MKALIWAQSFSQLPYGTVDMRETLNIRISDLPVVGCLCYTKHKRKTASLIGSEELISATAIATSAGWVLNREYRPPALFSGDLDVRAVRMVRSLIPDFASPAPILLSSPHVAIALARKSVVCLVESALPAQWILKECRQTSVVVVLKERRIIPG